MTQKQSARKFVEYWRFQRGSEKGEDQQFWNSLLGEVLGLEDVKSHIQYQVPVPMKGTTKFLDAWIPETRVLIEHKSRGVNLDAPQAGHNGLTPYEQAVEYDNARSYEDKARWIVTCNFDAIWIYDRSRPLEEPQKITLSELPKEVHRLAFLVKRDVQKVDAKELEISVQAGRIVGKFYDALLKQYGSETPETLAALNRLCVRLVFCLYAEDADIFPKDAFRNLVKATPIGFLRRQLLRLFQTLDTPPEKRDRYLEAELAIFPYTNGGLFAGASESEIPPLTDEIVKLLDGSSGFDWSGISPTIFGALFESTLNPQTRRAGGMVYTSVENIHKVIDPLFMDGLTARVDELLGNVANVQVLPAANTNSKLETGTGNWQHSHNGNIQQGENSALQLKTSTKKKLFALQDEMASLTFLDPACGSGNFLTETYLSMRRLENRIIAALQGGQSEFDLGEGIGAKVSIHQFKGIEINDFAVSVAKTAMWIAEAKMHAETCEILHSEPDFLPLKEYDGIVQGNALRTDWPQTNYIMGNPPFVGYSLQSKEQKADILDLYRDEKGKPYKTAGKVDYVAGWYWNAAELALAAKGTKVAFVSTNSICQGEQVAAVWKPLVERFGLEIDFAYRTFRWDSEASEKAHVHCVIVGFSFNGKLLSLRGDSETRRQGEDSEKSPNLQISKTPSNESNINTSRTSRTSRELKRIYDGDKVIEAEHINGYLMDGPDVWVESRTKPICDVPVMMSGNRPADGGYLLLSAEEKEQYLTEEPSAERYIKRFMMGYEFINNIPRYCFWLVGVSPAEIRKHPKLLERMKCCRDDRLKSSDSGRRRLAETPHLFREQLNPDNFIAIPKVSSEQRFYIPMGYLNGETIPGDKLFVIPNASLFHFGILTSSVHMAWMRVVCGRLKSDYSYSINIVYNNFPWPEVENVANVQVLPITNANCQLGNGECETENWKLENGTGNIGNTGNIKKTPNLPNSQSPSNESNHSESLQQKIESTAQAILDARALYPDSSLADLYDPLTMPIELRKAHAANDVAVMKAYGLAPHTSEPEIVAHLFRLYSEKVSL